MELVFSITAAYSRFAFTFYLILPTFSSKCLPTLEFCFSVFAEMMNWWSGFPTDSIYLNTLVCLCDHFCAHVTFHSGSWVAFKAGYYQRDFLLPLYSIIVPKESSSPYAVLFILVWRFSVNSTFKAFNKKKVCGITLYCFTWSGKALHQTAGAVQTVSPSPWGGHYDRDEQLKAL